MFFRRVGRGDYQPLSAKLVVFDLILNYLIEKSAEVFFEMTMPAQPEMVAAMEKMHSRLLEYEQRDALRQQQVQQLAPQPAFVPTKQEDIRQFFATKTVKEQQAVKREQEQSAGPIASGTGSASGGTTNVEEMMLRIKAEQLLRAQEYQGSREAAEPTGEYLQGGATEDGRVVLSTAQYQKLMKAAKAKEVTHGAHAPFPAAPSRSGNYYYLLLAAQSRTGKPRIIHGWKAAERQFAAGRSWEDGKPERGHLVQGFKTADLAHAAFVAQHPASRVVPLER